MVQRGGAGCFVDTDYRATDDPAHLALFVHADNVEGGGPESVSPWTDRATST